MNSMDDMNDPNDQLGDSEFIQIAGKFTIAAIVLLFMVIAFFFFLHLYARRYWWRVEDHAHHFENPRAVSAGQAAMNRGLDPTVLESLPVVVFSSVEFKDGLECSVCLSEVVDGEKTRLLPKCNHGFHVGCIDMWFQSHSTCPLCRNPVSSEPEAQAIGTTSAGTVVSGSLSESSQLPPVVDEGGPSHTVIDIPMETVAEICSSEDRCSADEAKSSPPVLTRMQTFKRLLSMGRAE